MVLCHLKHTNLDVYSPVSNDSLVDVNQLATTFDSGFII